MMPLLTTKGLSRNFGGLRAVDGVDFALMPGEIRAVIGPNGAGKTTFVSLVSGRIQPSSGMIVFDGADITNLPAYARVRLGIAYT
ncbi:MAG: ATP-binding cassette domain-containing protein, partial [Mesorhizobium sp.]